MANSAMTDFDGADEIRGGTDGTKVGNTGDRLNVQTQASHVDANNSTTTPLAGDAVFTGSWMDVLNHTNISVMISTDVDSATGGFVFQQSSDGTNIDDTDSFSITGGTSKQYTFGIAARYIRIVYTNGSSAQSYLRIQTIHHPFAPKPSSHRLDGVPIAEDDAELVKSVITGQTTAGGGSYVNVKVTPSGSLVTSRGEALPVDPTTSSGDLTALNETVVFDNSLGFASLGIQITGTWSGTVTFSVSINGTNYDTTKVYKSTNDTWYTGITANGVFERNIGSIRYIKATMTAYTSGTATISYFATDSQSNTVVARVSERETDGSTSNRELIPTIETEHQKIHEGRSYHWSDDFTLASGAARRFLMTCGTTAHTIFGLHTNGETEMYIYESPTGVTTSDVYTFKNRARFSSNTTSTTLKLVTAYSTLGSELTDLHIGTGTGNAISVQLQRGQEWDLRSGYDYMIELISASNGNDITITIDFYQNT